jgi:hypothetical protein
MRSRLRMTRLLTELNRFAKYDEIILVRRRGPILVFVGFDRPQQHGDERFHHHGRGSQMAMLGDRDFCAIVVSRCRREIHADLVHRTLNPGPVGPELDHVRGLPMDVGRWR